MSVDFEPTAIVRPTRQSASEQLVEDLKAAFERVTIPGIAMEAGILEGDAYFCLTASVPGLPGRIVRGKFHFYHRASGPITGQLYGAAKEVFDLMVRQHFVIDGQRPYALLG